MSYNLNAVPNISELLQSGDNIKTKATSLNLKYNLWKHKNGDNYHILKYKKELLTDETVHTLGLLRSVIYKDDGTLVCMAPPKSLPTENLVISSDKEYIAETFVEGSMINMFYDTTANSWEIATRSSVGAEMCFYMENGFNKDATFRAMFDEVCGHVEFDYKNYVGPSKRYVYSFVIQHPSNRIVSVVNEMRLYLVDVFEIVDNNTVNIIDFRKLDILDNMSDKIRTPCQSVLIDNDALRTCKDSCVSETMCYDIQGVIIKTNTGERYKFRNPNYEKVRHLRGNQPKLQYHYLTLRQSGKVAEYLQYYSEHRQAFEEFRKSMHDYTNQLFSNYRACYIKKERELKTFPDKYRIHMYKLHHELYLTELMPEKKYITKEAVIHYINGLHPAKCMFVLNYDMRPNKKESTSVGIQMSESI